MPFLHGFRRIIFEYQPLVDEILGLLALQDAARRSELESPACLGSDRSQLSAVRRVLERETHSPFYQEGVSYALLKVTELGLVTAAEILLEFGADLSFEDPVTYYTPLHIAVLRNQPDVVELLVRHGADINRRDRIHESSPLDLASEEPERLSCLQRLLQLGADVNAADKNGKTALLHALASSDGVQIHNTESIRLLLEGGADVRATTKDGDTVFTSLIFLLGEGVCSSTEEARVTNGFCFRVAQLLLAHGANPSECPAPESLTHLCLSNFKHHFSLLRFLLESGTAYNCCLHGPACWSGFQLVFECLCSHLSVPEDDSFYADLMQKGQTLLELMMASSQAVRLPSNFEVNTSGCRLLQEALTFGSGHGGAVAQPAAAVRQLLGICSPLKSERCCGAEPCPRRRCRRGRKPPVGRYLQQAELGSAGGCLPTLPSWQLLCFTSQPVASGLRIPRN